MYETGFAHFNSYGDAYWADVAAFQASLIYAREGNYPRAREHIEASLPALRLQKQRDMVAFKVASLGDIARLENDYALARRCYVEGIEIAREIGLRGVLLGLCGGLGFVALHDGDKKEARTLFAESFVLSKSLEREVTTAFVLTQLASLAAVENNSRRAVQLFAFGNGVFADSADGYLEPIDETEFARYLALARDQLTAQEFTAAWEEGRALTLELAIELAGEIANR